MFRPYCVRASAKFSRKDAEDAKEEEFCFELRRSGPFVAMGWKSFRSSVGAARWFGRLGMGRSYGAWRGWLACGSTNGTLLRSWGSTFGARFYKRAAPNGAWGVDRLAGAINGTPLRGWGNVTRSGGDVALTGENVTRTGGPRCMRRGLLGEFAGRWAAGRDGPAVRRTFCGGRCNADRWSANLVGQRCVGIFCGAMGCEGWRTGGPPYIKAVRRAFGVWLSVSPLLRAASAIEEPTR